MGCNGSRPHSTMSSATKSNNNNDKKPSGTKIIGHNDNKISITELTIKCSDGIQLAGQLWKRADATAIVDNDDETATRPAPPLNILCLHGWLDNCASFHYLAPELVVQLDNNDNNNNGEEQRRRSVNVVAIDLPGHGWSSHKSLDGPPMVVAEYIPYVAEVIQQLQWWNKSKKLYQQQQSFDDCCNTPIVLMGHSMGTSIALLYTAAFPEQIQKLILLDSDGSLDRPVEYLTTNLRSYVERRLREIDINLNEDFRFLYPSIEDAIKARCRTPKTFPGNQYISTETARALVECSIVQQEDNNNNNRIQSNPNNGGGRQYYYFRTDTRLYWPMMLNLTLEQVEQLYKMIGSSTCETCILLGEDG